MRTVKSPDRPRSASPAAGAVRLELVYPLGISKRGGTRAMSDETDLAPNTGRRQEEGKKMSSTREPVGSTSGTVRTAVRSSGGKATIRIRVLHEDIARVGQGDDSSEAFPIDAIAVGHYQDVTPVRAERGLDEAISQALHVNGTGPLVITGFTERQIISGDTARPFFLPDPRRPERLIALAGMGYPGQFAAPDLTVLVRELCWSLGMLGKKHLATVLIGSGNGNLEVERAVEAWMRGAAAAVSGAAASGRHLHAITFVEGAPKRLAQIQGALAKYAKAAQGIQVELVPLTQSEIDRAFVAGGPVQTPTPKELSPARITVEIHRGKFRFGALTEEASIPEEELKLDPKLVFETNQKLVEAETRKGQLEGGIDLYRKLVPPELQPRLTTGAPLVIICGHRTAQICWEMLAQPGIAGHDRMDAVPEEMFLGLARGLTRQLRIHSTPRGWRRESSRVLKVLIVADPARDRPLDAAREEGRRLSQLFKRYGQAATPAGNRLVVKALIGPDEATRSEVIKELQKTPYDVLHFAGHCEYSSHHRAASGWVFSHGEMFTSDELRQIDSVPGFVCANACASGALPDHSSARSLDLAPSLAEEFFLGGVTNFVCTAWRVNDRAAFAFAATLYSVLLGLEAPPRPMHAAMREARLAARAVPGGLSSWGAYQHYGNPYFRLFEPRA